MCIRDRGIKVQQGEIHIHPRFLKQSEFLSEPVEFTYFDIHNQSQTIHLPNNTLAYTYCQVPFIYQLGAEEKIELYLEDGLVVSLENLKLDKAWSEELFGRTGKVVKISIQLSE